MHWRARLALRALLYAFALDAVIMIAIALERFRIAPWLSDDPRTVAGPVSSVVFIPILFLGRLFPFLPDSPIAVGLLYTVAFAILFFLALRRPTTTT